MVKCNICSNGFDKSPDSIVICEHMKGTVHHGCCTDRCSQDGKPCVHCKGVYKRK